MDRADVAVALQAWDAGRAALAALPFEAMTGAELLAIYEHHQRGLRQDAALDHTVLAHLTEQFDPDAYGNTALRDVLAERLHLDVADTKKRLAAAENLGPGWGPLRLPQPPRWTATATALARGVIDTAHVKVIEQFFTQLSPWVDTTARDDAERDLAAFAATMRPADLRNVADRLRDLIDPDGAEPDHDHQQARRSLHIGTQRRDGMTPIRGDLDPDTAALLDVIIAKHGAPGTNLPADPGAGEAIAQELHGGDPRSQAQRHHDALKTGLRDAVTAGSGGRVNALPATIVATTTLGELEAAAGYATTATETRLPIRDLIALAGQSRHYLAVFDDHTNEVLYLGRAKRCATTAQRLALFARDRGCTRPGCTRPAIDCHAHHAQADWHDGGRTDIDHLALACPPDNTLIEHTTWTTRRHHGRTEGIPPPTLDTGQTRVNHHHPHRYLTDREDDGDGPG